MPRPGVLSIGPIALIMRKGISPSLRRARSTYPNAPLILWRDLVGSSFLYTAANWGAITWYLEVYMLATSAKALARLYDITTSLEVSNSIVILDAGLLGVLTKPTRVRSSSLTLIDNHEYRIQYGVQDGGAGTSVSAKLIAV